ncbi:protein UL116 [Mandrillus leucophaeus cytomegalovirus]|uniref:Protein UL116 n=1 Tax=Mandrillus leucophaeus cytomegalovirus TaxID=1654930 RepID=A0A0G2UPB8_9BETA|nr:protein UL116 [Mandrillus leucophaeus cytomegalovirus]AKI29746.1 protein UL116 [Mandrillus leucophaeus cytomegalovirus]
MRQAMRGRVLLVALFAITGGTAVAANNTTTTNASTSTAVITTTVPTSSTNTTTATTSPATTNVSSASPASSPATTNSTQTTATSSSTIISSSSAVTTGVTTSTSSNNTSITTASNSTSATNTNGTVTPTSELNVTTTVDSTTDYSNETFNATTPDPYTPLQIVDLCNETIAIVFRDEDGEPEENSRSSEEADSKYDSNEDTTYFPQGPGYTLSSDSDDAIYFYANCERNDTSQNVTSCNYTNQPLTSWSLVTSVSFYPAELTNCKQPVAVIQVGNNSLVVSAEATSNLVDAIYKVLGFPDLSSSFLKELGKFQHLIIQGQTERQKWVTVE